MINETGKELPSLFTYLWALVKNPIEEIKRIPSIEWPTLLIFQFCLSFISVVVSNLLAPFTISLINVMVSLVVAILATGLVSLFFYYFFLLLYSRQMEFIKIFTLVLFAHIPFAIFHLGAYFFPPADLIGLAISALLMVVGLVENFSVPRKLATQLMIGCYSLFFIYWAVHLITMRQHQESTLPQDLDKIEQEIRDSI
jgi:hypothetical protein